MLKVRGFKGGLGSVVFIAALICAGRGPGFAQPVDFDPVIQVLEEIAQSPSDKASPARNAQESAAVTPPRFSFPITLTPKPDLVLRLQALFASYFDQRVDLSVLLQKLITESAVSELPGVGHVLYNPAHMLFLYLPERSNKSGNVRVATLEDLGEILKKEKAASPTLSSYTQGFEEFALLSELMKDAAGRESVEIIWTTSPRSEVDKERMRYLLLRPVEQAAAIRNETRSCRQVISRFVDDVRAGKRAAIANLPGLTNIVRPTRFIRHENQILLVLSESLTARYYVIAKFNVTAGSCNVEWEEPIFAM